MDKGETGQTEKSDEDLRSLKGVPAVVASVKAPLAFAVVSLIGIVFAYYLFQTHDTAFYVTLIAILVMNLLVFAIAWYRPEALSGLRADYELRTENEDLKTRLAENNRDKDKLRGDIEVLEKRVGKLEAEKETLEAALSGFQALSTRVIAVLTAHGSMTVEGLASRLQIPLLGRPYDGLLGVLGSLSAEKKIVRDTSQGGAYYKLS
uniref:Uncharacterized protein n=1 Tax=Solibacter usitatus (strain Ellin6076) TaxID=234267 RepID=Q01YK2_SOLUE